MVSQSKGWHERAAKVENSIRPEAERFATAGMTSASAVMLDSGGSG